MGTAPFTKPATIVKTFIVIINRVRKNIFHSDKSFRVESDVEMIKNDYPMTTPHFKFNAKKDLYELNIEVNDLGPVERFLRGVE